MNEHDGGSIDPRDLGLNPPQPILKDGRGIILWDSTKTERSVVNQNEGFKSLGEYLAGKSFDALRPFIIDNLAGSSKRPNSYYLGTIEDKEIYTTLNPQITEQLQQGKSVIAVPKQDEDEYYQWVDFYSLQGDVVDTDHTLGSYRLDQESKRVVTRGWYGFERQLFIDFLTGVRNLHPTQLKPFIAPSTRFQTVIFGYQDEKPIATKIVELEPEASQQITFVPKYDERRIYSWIEGYMNKEGQEVMICSRRVNPGIATFSESAWKGPEIQAMIDWISGKLPIGLVGPLSFHIEGEPPRLPLEETANSKIVFSLQNNPSLKGAKEIILNPKQDDLYQWVEVLRDDETSENGYRLANYYRVLYAERNRLQGSWMGPEEQRYYDYLEGKLDFSQVREMSMQTLAHAIVSLFTFKGRHLSLQLNDLANFPKGQEVRIIPSLNDAGDLIIAVAKAGTDVIAKRFIFDKQTNSFRIINEQGEVTGKPAGYWTPENTEREVRAFYEAEGSLGFLKKSRNDIYIAARKYPGGIEALERKLGIESPPQVDKETGIYTDKGGKIWSHAFFLGNELGFHPASSNRILRESGLPSILGRSKSGAEVPLYEAEAAKRILLASGYLERKATPRTVQISLEEIIRNLDPLNPQVIRDKGGRIRWTYPGNSDEQNEVLGIGNIQALFLQNVPEFVELFRLQNGAIDPNLIEAAKSFIEDRIGTLSKFTEVMGISPDSLRSVSYFKAGLPDVLNRSFSPWGIEFEVPEKVRKIRDLQGPRSKIRPRSVRAEAKIPEIIPPRNIQTTEGEVIAVGQKDGLKRLKEFMNGSSEFGNVVPFTIDSIPGNEDRGYHLVVYTYGGRKKIQAVVITPSDEMVKPLQEGKSLLCVPMQDSNNFYQWLEFFEVMDGETVDSQQVLGSYRIDNERQRINTLGWYGPEIQTFLDYLAEKIDISSELPPSFGAVLRQVGDGRFYADIGRTDSKNVRFAFSNSENRPEITPGAEVELRPVIDHERGYSWVEGYIKDIDGNNISLGSKRFIRGEVGLYEWRGPETQAVIDWINGELPIEKTSPITVSLDNKSLLLCLQATQENKIMIQFAGNKSLTRYDTLQIVPQSDGTYDWVDVYKTNETGGEITLITQALITRGNKYKLQGGWVGPERQREKDGIKEAPISSNEANEWLRNLLQEDI